MKVTFPIFLKGFIALLFLIFIMTITFNWFWTGTGLNPERNLFPAISNNFNEFKEYATLYIALLSFCASMFAGLAIFLVFNDWKDQHNKNIDTQLFMKAYDFIDHANYEIIMITGFLKDYISLSNKEEHKEDLKKQSNRLCHLHDTTTINLSNLAYFVDKSEYETKLQPQIKKISESLLLINDVFLRYINDQEIVQPIDEFTQILEGLMIEIRDRYRGFIVELEKYYRA